MTNGSQFDISRAILEILENSETKPFISGIKKRKGFNSYLSDGLFHPYILDESICHLRVVWFAFLFYF